MDRQPPRSTNDAIELYIRTYYSLLRSSGFVRVRAFEEAHLYSNSSLHEGALDAETDVAAFAYSAGRLPSCFPQVGRLVLGQSIDQMQSAGYPVDTWSVVTARGRRRAMRFDGTSTLAVFITSVSDIDDLVPIVTAYQIEWQKLHGKLAGVSEIATEGEPGLEDVALWTGLSEAEVEKLTVALGGGWLDALRRISSQELDLKILLLDSSFNRYQRSAGNWWRGIEPAYRGPRGSRPAYFVSSNTHALANLVGGYANEHRDEIATFASKNDHEGLADDLQRAIATGDEALAKNLLYYLFRAYLHEPNADTAVRRATSKAFDAQSGISSVESPGRIDVNAQLFELAKLRPDRLDSRAVVDGLEELAESDAVIINIDYPLGMAAYHHLIHVDRGISRLLGAYVMGKAATLNGRVGDVLLSQTIHDEHSKNTFLFRNAITAADVEQYMRFGSVLDNQKAVTVRSAYLQNRDYMSVFYDEGYTVMEMEAGPYLSAIFEIVDPRRHPNDQVVHLSNRCPFDVGVVHYASDTPYSRRQSLLSKSMSYFGVESTYACSIAILKRILGQEVSRLRATGR